MGNPSLTIAILSWHFCSFIILIIVANARISCSIQSEITGSCPPSSCGNLTNISYPFRLSTDLLECDNTFYQFELECDGGQRTILYSSGHKLYVEDISYLHNTIKVTYNISELSNSCSLPPVFQNLTSVDDGFSSTYGNTWASFVNCTQKLVNESYMEVPCLSSGNTTVHVVVGGDVNSIIYLPENCNAMDTFRFGSDTPNSGLQVLELFQQGFLLHWDFDGTKNQSFKIEVSQCWEDATQTAKKETDGFTILHKMVLYPIKFETRFVGCVYERENFKNDKHLIFSVILIIFLHIAAILSGCAIICRFILAPFVVCAFLVYCYLDSKVYIDKIEKFLQKQHNLSPTRYTYGDITALTRHFKEKLGQGGFGSVYKGELPGGRLVAIKVLKSSIFDGEEFISEVSTIGRIHHVNVVQLLGFCFEGPKRALVYEYMPNGSLDKYIFSSNKSQGKSTLSPEQLNSIALGVAKGIDYLHRGCDMQILHFDIKPHNILLDQNFCPKISDFGLAKLYPRDHSIISISAARGTIGYIAPELISRNFGLISYKSDVYSFGMLLMEIAGRRRNVDPSSNNSSAIYYPSWIYDQLTQLELPNYDEIYMNIDELEKKLCKVGLWCIQMNPSKRPSMSKVIDMLESNADDIPLAPKPFVSCPDTKLFDDPSDKFPSSVELSIIEEHDVFP